MISLSHYVPAFAAVFPGFGALAPWMILDNRMTLLRDKMAALPEEAYDIRNGVAVHRSAIIETGVVLKAPVIIGPGCFIGAHAYLRDGVFLEEDVSIGPGCEVKASLIFASSALAHFNFAGNSIIGRQVNLEAGAVIANHYNERAVKQVYVNVAGKRIHTGMDKFGALVGDQCKIGANAVLSPGTLLEPRTVVGRLVLIEQNPPTEP
ncbi:DapH/DapD/GlmU-related protein [Taibaiella chishuiensis]|uniref:Transferase family hexapeptide repeat protein n=1 Tax=Taibaiella chishuiensis TaxID=1434707 RepID=A0A2P8D863_9BACT|nr:DapH/DapD/GlmU-related protein [Taibaiella chishuiensis]PSK93398.1 transferase family hexapeptide repeat protein [Taibaiella chishuiensis]